MFLFSKILWAVAVFLATSHTASVHTFSSEHFFICYSLGNTPHAVSPDSSESNIPPPLITYAVQTLEKSYHILTDSLKMQPPLGNAWSPYYKKNIQIKFNGRLLNDSFTEPFSAYASTLSHELFHAFYEHVDPQLKSGVFIESSAVWFEHSFFPKTVTYLSYFNNIILTIQVPLPKLSREHGYGFFPFLTHINKQYPHKHLSFFKQYWSNRLRLGQKNKDHPRLHLTKEDYLSYYNKLLSWIILGTGFYNFKPFTSNPATVLSKIKFLAKKNDIKVLSDFQFTWLPDKPQLEKIRTTRNLYLYYYDPLNNSIKYHPYSPDIKKDGLIGLLKLQEGLP